MLPCASTTTSFSARCPLNHRQNNPVMLIHILFFHQNVQRFRRQIFLHGHFLAQPLGSRPDRSQLGFTVDATVAITPIRAPRLTAFSAIGSSTLSVGIAVHRLAIAKASPTEEH